MVIRQFPLAGEAHRIWLRSPPSSRKRWPIFSNRVLFMAKLPTELPRLGKCGSVHLRFYASLLIQYNSILIMHAAVNRSLTSSRAAIACPLTLPHTWDRRCPLHGVSFCVRPGVLSGFNLACCRKYARDVVFSGMENPHSRASIIRFRNYLSWRGICD